MPDALRTAPATHAKGALHRYRLLALVVGVLVAHGVLLSGLSQASAAPNTPAPTPASDTGNAQTRVMPMTTRTVAEPSARVVPPTRVTETLPTRPPHTALATHTPLARLEPSTSAPESNDTVQSAVVLIAAADTRPAEGSAATQAAPAKDSTPVRITVVPEPVRLKYDIRGEARGFPYSVDGEMLWQHDGTNYEARLAISHFLLGSRVQTSKGSIGPYGLEPVRFGDKVRSEVAAHFDRTRARVTFSANTPDVALQTGAQDQLSVFMQLASLFGSAPNRYPTGSAIPFQAIGPRSSEDWVFKVEGPEKLTLAGTEVTTIKLSRAAIGDFDARGEVWLAPSMGYMPARIRITQSNGDFIDQRWSATQKP